MTEDQQIQKYECSTCNWRFKNDTGICPQCNGNGIAYLFSPLKAARMKRLWFGSDKKVCLKCHKIYSDTNRLVCKCGESSWESLKTKNNQ